MSKTEMPVIEAGSYELAFHVLPTVAEGEVATVFQGLKDLIVKHGGETTLEEAPARFDLAYEIVKYLEGRNRKFSSAYFGWVRFTVNPTEVDEIGKTVEGNKQILRHILIKLTKAEEANPFMFHEALADSDKVKTIELDEEVEEEVEDSEEVLVETDVVEDTEDEEDKK
ncbi:30S ribosomal protein S6 [Candidatus Nomurabacteria bacterium]|nr:30S ribosomal protein S6 [Candidatus Kaiserbacteria bacterium]MCB9815172.1 30S ribosomal protein S6 [Candidatus Nomurabacteria bacterium]